MSPPLAHPRVVHLLPGRRVALRPAVPQDIPGIAALFAGLSAESFTLRFRSHRPSTTTLLHLAEIDRSPGTISVVAERVSRAGIVVAEARALPLGQGSADLGISVADSYQSSGLGRLLLDAVLDQARHRGLQALRAVVGPANTAMLKVLARGGWAINEPGDGDLLELEAAPDRLMPAFPPRDGRRRVLVEGGDWTRDLSGTRWRDSDLVRRCLGPAPGAGRSCPLLLRGRCRLAEGADVIVSRLPGDHGLAVMAAHRRRWPGRLRPVATSAHLPPPTTPSRLGRSTPSNTRPS